MVYDVNNQRMFRWIILVSCVYKLNLHICIPWLQMSAGRPRTLLCVCEFESVESQFISLLFTADTCCPLAAHVGPTAEGPHRVVESVSC